jgi:SAM-dependent methyltransferase
VITPDGCAVDFYALLPPGRESGVIDAAVPPGSSILELGCGAGRVTHPLVAMGHRVVAVDESADMLAHVRGARTVQAAIESLELPERFDVVVLGSNLINVPDDDQLAAFLTTCARHLSAHGCVLLERHPVGWFDEVVATERQVGDITYLLYDIAHDGPDLVSATVEYRVGTRTWTHEFVTRRLDDTRLAQALADAGLRLDAVLTDDCSWLRALPVAASVAAASTEDDGA